MGASAGEPGLPPRVLAAHLASLRQRGHSTATVEARARALTRMAARLPGPLLAATPADLAAWRASLAVTGNTVLTYASHARDFYDWATAQGLRAGPNPAAGLPLPRRVRGLPRPIGEQALMDAVTTAPPRVRPWLVLAGWCGLRACEIAGLRRQRVLDTASPPVILVASDATKGHRERVIPLSGFVIAELRVAGLPPAGWVFTRRDGQGGPNAPHTVSHLANEHLRACGTGATLHQCRHRFATAVYRQTRDLRLVQDLLGHADPATTALYAAFDNASAVTAVEAVPVPPRFRAVTGRETG